MKKLYFFLAAITILASVSYAQAATIWKDDFSDANRWEIVSDPGGDSTITTSNGLGALYVNGGSTLAAFAPRQKGVEDNLAPFDPAKKSEYTLICKVDHLTKSVSWDIAIDEFDSNKQYIDTVWNVYPEKGSCASTGELLKNLGSFSFNAKAAYIAPKINIHTGLAKQTVYFKSIQIDRK